MAVNLKGRLARIRELGLVKAAGLERSAERDATIGRGATIRRDRPSFLGGWVSIGELAWTRTLHFADSLLESVDPSVFAPLRRNRGGAPPGATDTRGGVPAERIPAERLRFFDLETTGLSGGTGTIAFLAAVGRVEKGEFALTQVFLEDFPGEPAFLAFLLSLLADDAVIVSYNGRAFDMPLLRTRCVMNGIVPPEPDLHVDALFASRRLWRRVHGGASLGLLEREVLGLEREEDLPGAMIPEVWLSFVRKGDHPLMRLVLSHNANDVVGLARLVARAQALFDDPYPRAGSLDVDRFGLGRTLLAAGRPAAGEELLESAAGAGDEGAGLLLSMRYRKAARVADGLRVAAMLPETYRCAVERAKLYERSIGDLAEAARWAKEALRLASTDGDRAETLSRLARIGRKMARKK
ncbi:MAG: ribonuclease H-like domain-containing protein [Rectinemataceae bacterium]